jgi:hypothetical protein
LQVLSKNVERKNQIFQHKESFLASNVKNFTISVKFLIINAKLGRNNVKILTSNVKFGVKFLNSNAKIGVNKGIK